MKRIMIIDDEPNTLELVRAILEMNGFSVNTFTEAKVALDALRRGNKPDLILLDMRMPEMSGPDFCKKIRGDKFFKRLKIVFFTASANANKKLQNKFQVLGYIFKPFDNARIIKDVQKYLLVAK